MRRVWWQENIRGVSSGRHSALGMWNLCQLAVELDLAIIPIIPIMRVHAHLTSFRAPPVHTLCPSSLQTMHFLSFSNTAGAGNVRRFASCGSMHSWRSANCGGQSFLPLEQNRVGTIRSTAQLTTPPQKGSERECSYLGLAVVRTRACIIRRNYRRPSRLVHQYDRG